MKTLGLCAGAGVLAFVLAGMQSGMFQELPVSTGEESSSSEEKPDLKKEEPKAVKAHFPKALAPAARAEPVAQAAPYDPNAKFNRMVILKTTGALYHEWQEKLREEWQAESVEETVLALVMGPQKRIFIETIPYPNGAPPITRYKFELEVSIVEAKTGKVLANRLFINMARNILRVETWDTTALGSPVDFRTVFSWAASLSRSGFPQDTNTGPIVNVVN